MLIVYDHTSFTPPATAAGLALSTAVYFPERRVLAARACTAPGLRPTFSTGPSAPRLGSARSYQTTQRIRTLRLGRPAGRLGPGLNCQCDRAINLGGWSYDPSETVFFFPIDPHSFILNGLYTENWSDVFIYSLWV